MLDKVQSLNTDANNCITIYGNSDDSLQLTVVELVFNLSLKHHSTKA